ncbi:MAG: M13 family metallopeptidase [Ferruginibacter sp.]
MKHPYILAAFLLPVITCSISCSNKAADTVAKETPGLSMQFIDSSLKPGDDFYMYANGKWYDTATILPTESRAGSRLEMDYIAKAHIKSILEETAAAKNTAGSIEQKVGDLFAAGMDTATIEKLGYDPVKPWLKQIDSIKDVNGILSFVAEQYTLGAPMLIGQIILVDEKNSSTNIPIYYQAGLGLPDRDYYFKTDEATKTVVKSYQNYIRTLCTLTGDDSAAATKNTAIVYDIEKQLAAAHRTNVELRDPESNYNKLAVTDLDKKMPVIAWKNLLAKLGIKTDSVNVSQPGYYSKLNDLLKTIPLDNWKAYLRFHLIDKSAGALSSNFVNASFEYNNKTLSGQKKLKERWERIYRIVDANIGEALGELYVKKYFSVEAKQKMQTLVNNLQAAFENRITKLDWMSDSTKQKAIAKLHTFIKKIGFPDKWRDYSNVTINRDDFFGSLVSCSVNEYNYQVAKAGKPVDKTEWQMTPPTNNAYYNPTINEIVFPAGILQFPMFDVNSDDALNYGGIGMVIGHEITHGFDDQGAQYDKDGNLKNWWSKEDLEKFKAKSEQVVKLYNSFTVLDSLHVNGNLTLGENIADIGGIAIAYDAFKMTAQGKDTAKIQGLTPDQRFFLSMAQCWRKKIKDEAMRQQVNTDPHSPGMFRVRGPLMNFDPFYAAFNIQQGDKMFVPEKDRIHIW